QNVLTKFRHGLGHTGKNPCGICVFFTEDFVQPLQQAWVPIRQSYRLFPQSGVNLGLRMQGFETLTLLAQVCPTQGGEGLLMDMLQGCEVDVIAAGQQQSVWGRGLPDGPYQGVQDVGSLWCQYIAPIARLKIAFKVIQNE